jgi:heptosyltransferase-2
VNKDRTSRILLRGVNWLGDAVMSTPALLRLRERYSDAHITMLTPEKSRDLWLHHPAVNEVVSFAPGDGVFSIGRRLRQKNFNLALVLPNSPRSALEVWLAGISQRVGYARPWRNWFLTQRVPERPSAVAMRKRTVNEINRLIHSPALAQPSALNFQPASAHHIHQYLHLVAALGANPEPLAPRLEVTEDEIIAVRKKFGLEETSAGGRPLLALNPGAEYGPAKRWPIVRFAEAVREIQKHTTCQWVVLGGKAEAEIQRAADILSAEQNFRQDAGSTFLNLAGRTSLRELMALLKCCRVLLTNDTGPMHVAAALGTPVVVPFGSTSPELTGPGLPGDTRHRLLKSDAPCSPCFLRECPIDFRCMTGISVERVVQAVLGVLSR